MLLHATTHWPEQQHLNLWPYAFEHAIFLWNNLPGHTSGVAPLELSPASLLIPLLTYTAAMFGDAPPMSWIIFL